jgi:hypothetical protein
VVTERKEEGMEVARLKQGALRSVEAAVSEVFAVKVMVKTGSAQRRGVHQFEILAS